MESISFEDFNKVQIRLGKVIDVLDFPEARKPAYKLTIDFGPEIGVKKSSAQITVAHTKKDLMGKLVMGVVNFPPKQIGPFVSEVLTLGFPHPESGYTAVTLEDDGRFKVGDRLA